MIGAFGAVAGILAAHQARAYRDLVRSQAEAEAAAQNAEAYRRSMARYRDRQAWETMKRAEPVERPRLRDGFDWKANEREAYRQ